MNGYTLTLDNGKIAEIIGCVRVVSYGSEKIVLAVPGNRLTLAGKRLTLSSFFPKEITVSGEISSITTEVSR